MPKFEECLQRLEEIVQELEKGEVPLEKSLTLFEEGMQLSAACRKDKGPALKRGVEVEVLVAERRGWVPVRPQAPPPSRRRPPARWSAAEENSTRK